jgi:hypothetical protein
MTALEQALTKDTLERIDRYRRERGIRTREAALEAIVAAAVPLEEVDEHPLTRKLLEARANPSREKVPDHIRDELIRVREARENGTLETFTLDEVMEGIRLRARGD